MTEPAATVTAADAVARRLAGRRIDVAGLAFQGLLLLALLMSLALLVILLADIVSAGGPVLAERRTGFLTGPMAEFPDLAGVWLGLVGSFFIAAFVVLIAFPIGVGAAVYLEEYARDTRFTRFVTVNIRNLAGVPSIVYGLLGLAIFATTLRPVTGGPSLLSAGLTIAILVLPIVIITAAEALRAVPGSIREAGYGVGATKWEVIRHHVLPAAAPGILTGTVLSLSRGLGETAPLIMLSGVTGFLVLGEQNLVELLRGRFTALPVLVFGWARRPDPGFREVTSAAIIVLLAIILLFNAAAILLRNRYERRW